MNIELQLNFQTGETEFYFQPQQAGISARLLGRSLIGLDGVVNEAIRLFHRRLALSEPVPLWRDDHVSYQDFTLGSYKDSFLVRIFLGDEEEAEAKIETLRRSLKLDRLTPKTLLGGAVFAAVLYGLHLFASEDDEPAQVITINFYALDGAFGDSPEEFVSLMRGLVSSPAELRYNVAQLLSRSTNARTIRQVDVSTSEGGRIRLVGDLPTADGERIVIARDIPFLVLESRAELSPKVLLPASDEPVPFALSDAIKELFVPRERVFGGTFRLHYYTTGELRLAELIEMTRLSADAMDVHEAGTAELEKRLIEEIRRSGTKQRREEG